MNANSALTTIILSLILTTTIPLLCSQEPTQSSQHYFSGNTLKRCIYPLANVGFYGGAATILITQNPQVIMKYGARNARITQKIAAFSTLLGCYTILFYHHKPTSHAFPDHSTSF